MCISIPYRRCENCQISLYRRTDFLDEIIPPPGYIEVQINDSVSSNPVDFAYSFSDILLVILHYLILNISIIVIYNTVILELYISLGIAIMYTITLSAFILLFSTIIPKVNLTTIIVILIYFIGFFILEEGLTAINQEIEPIFSLNYIGNLINHVVPGGLPVGQRWNWVYYAGDTLPPVKLWITPTIEVGILIMIFYIALLFLFTLLALKRKEFF